VQPNGGVAVADLAVDDRAVVEAVQPAEVSPNVPTRKSWPASMSWYTRMGTTAGVGVALM